MLHDSVNNNVAPSKDWQGKYVVLALAMVGYGVGKNEGN